MMVVKGKDINKNPEKEDLAVEKWIILCLYKEEISTWLTDFKG